MGKKIEIGNQYGIFQILSVDLEYLSKYKHYIVRCLKCGNEFSATGQNILKYQNYGCLDCRRAKKHKSMEIQARQYIGKMVGSIEIVDILGIQNYAGNKAMIVKILCHKCGNISTVPLSRVRTKRILECHKCTQVNLKLGHEITKIARVDGTLITAIDGRRKTNKNNSSGYTGVSIYKPGKWRAYITFKRRQYYLGLYDTIDDAINARKIAEEHIFGDFLKWYAFNYPDQWEKIKKK